MPSHPNVVPRLLSFRSALLLAVAGLACIMLTAGGGAPRVPAHAANGELREGLSREDEEGIKARMDSFLGHSWESACLGLARRVAKEGDTDRSLRLLKVLRQRQDLEPLYLYRALHLTASIAIESGRFQTAIEALEEFRANQAWDGISEPFAGCRFPPKAMAEQKYWAFRLHLLQEQGKIREALTCCDDAQRALESQIKTSSQLGDDGRREMRTTLQSGLAEKRSELLEQLGDYRSALSVLQSAVDSIAGDPQSWEFVRARRGQMRQNWEKMSAERVQRYQTGAMAQEYLEAWRDTDSKTMLAQLSAQQIGGQSAAEIVAQLTELSASGVRPREIDGLTVTEIAIDSARVRANVSFAKERPPDMVSGQYELQLAKADGRWLISRVRPVELTTPDTTLAAPVGTRGAKGDDR